MSGNEPLDAGGRKTVKSSSAISVRGLGGAVAIDIGEITLPRRPFTDVHELVYLFQSWQLILDAENIPDVLRPLQSIPEHLVATMTQLLADAQAQLESAQAGTEIALRFPATPEFSELMRWGWEQLKHVEGSIGDETLHENWVRAIQLAKDFVGAALEQMKIDQMDKVALTD
jgi:hypothetical protein